MVLNALKKIWNRLQTSAEPAPVAIPVYERAGYCPICEQAVVFTARHTWLRDHYLCNGCHSIPRERAVMRAIQRLYPNWRDLVMHESSPVFRGTSLKLKTEGAYYLATQYDPDLGFGRFNDEQGYQSEDLEAQTFEDGVFDLVITQDVFEHIFDPKKAFAEIQRTLKPGGAHIFTTPIVRAAESSMQRAMLDEAGNIVHLHPPEYHGNPMSAEGSLVTWHWGTDIVELISGITGDRVELIDEVVPENGIEAKLLEVIVQFKTLAGA